MKGATYQVGVSVRLVAGEAPTTIRMTMQRTLLDGTNQFDTIAQNTNVTDGAWVTLNNPSYSFSTDVTGLLLYVEATSATASYYIDAFSLVETAPPPLSSDFEDGTLQGWIPRGPRDPHQHDRAGLRRHAQPEDHGTDRGIQRPEPPAHRPADQGRDLPGDGLGAAGRGDAPRPPSASPCNGRRPAARTRSIRSRRTPTITDAAWVTMTAAYSFSTDVTGLLLYVESDVAPPPRITSTASASSQLAPPPGPPGNTLGAAATFESGALEGWFSRTGAETVTNTTADAHGGTRSLLTTNRTATFRGPAFNVTNVMFNGSRYRVERVGEAGAGRGEHAAAGQPGAAASAPCPATFHTVVGNTTVTNGAWVQLAATFDSALANTSLTLYVETASGNQSFYIDDFKITFIPPRGRRAGHPVGVPDHGPVLPGRRGGAARPISPANSAVLLTKHFNSITSENDMKWDATEPTLGTFTFANADAQVAFAKANNMQVRGHTLVWHAQTPAWVFNDAERHPDDADAGEPGAADPAHAEPHPGRW